MDAPSFSSSSPPPAPRCHQSDTCFSAEIPAIPITVDPNPTVGDSPSSGKPVSNGKTKKKRANKDVPSTSSSCSSCSTQRGTRMELRRRNMRVVRFGPLRRSEGGDMEAIALPLGMSFAAVVAQKTLELINGLCGCCSMVAQSHLPGKKPRTLSEAHAIVLESRLWAMVKVLERKNAPVETMSIDHLSRICTSAVRESLTNVFGDKFDYFSRNFEKSFGSTLSTLRLINESSADKGGYHLNNRDVSTLDVTSSEVGCTNTCGVNYSHSRTDLPTIETQDFLSAPEDVQEQISANFIRKELALHGQNNQLVCASSNRLGPVINQNVLTTMEKSVIEQVRSNDLKTVELSLALKKLKLKETQLALNLDSNHLVRSKLAMGISNASFKAEKFKNKIEETRHSELRRKCIDCLVSGMVVMSASLSYAAYVYSYRKISEATAVCTPSPQESKSWWILNTVASFNSGLNTLKCQVQVVSRMLFGVLMILTIAYLLIQRSASSRQTMPVTFILLLLGVACGFAGKLCVDTLGGSGYLWLLYWEALCFVHFFSNMWTSALFHILHGPVKVSQGMKTNTIIPHWVRRSLFYSSMVLFIPLVCGLMPFASLGEWRDHFTLLVLDYHSSTG